MDAFEAKMTELLDAINPTRINLSNDIYNFSQIEKAEQSKLPYYLKVGKLQNGSVSLPALVPFIDAKGMVYLYHKTDEDNSKLYMQNLVFELINKISPNKIEIVIYDPVFMGVPFNYVSRINLDNVSVELITDEANLQTRLHKYLQFSKELIANKLIHFNGFLDYWVNSNDNAKSYTIFILNDTHFVRNSAVTDTINRITANTKNNNSFFILSDEEEKRERFSFFNPEIVIQNYGAFYKQMKIDLEYEKARDRLEASAREMMSNKQSRPINIESYNISEGIKIPIGILGSNNKPQHFKLGCGTGNYHAIIGGQSGKGKTYLIETIIQNGMSKYRSNELKFVLFDCKGVEFENYKGDPYVLECESTNNIALIVEKLKVIDKEFETRRELFKINGVSSIDKLYEKGVEIPRLLCIIDEFQFLFPVSDYKTTQFSEDLLVQKIIKTGRGFGIHLLVATQTLGDGVRRSILDNIPLRIALGMNETQSNSFLAYNNAAAKNLDQGLAIYNDGNGELEANKLIKVIR